MPGFWRALGAALWVSSAATVVPAAVQTWPAQPQPRGMLTMRSMKVQGAAAEGSRIYLGPQSEYSFGMDSAANFVVQQASRSQPLLLFDSQNTLHLGAQRMEALSVDAAGGFSVRGVRQWRLVHAEDFSAQGLGWSRQEVSRCAGVSMLGGYCKLSHGEVNKTFAGLPPHKQLRVVATYHFIDRWVGESGYLKLSVGQEGLPVVVWSEQHSQQMSKNGMSICGRSETPEGKFSVSIDVTVPHLDAAVLLAFGSTMDASDPCDESWGVSGVEIYTRN